MNCKPGDLAVIVRPRLAENMGRFVTVVESIGEVPADTSFTWRGKRHYAVTGGFYWWCDAQSPLFNGDELVAASHISDACLRPIRDNPWKDETLSWAGHPLQKTADDVAELHRQVDRLADIARQLAAIQKLL